MCHERTGGFLFSGYAAVVNRIILNAAELTADCRVRLTDHRAQHILTVLKPSVGDTLKAAWLNGARATATIIALEPDAVTLLLAAQDTPPLPPLDLLLAVPRPKVLRRLWSPLAQMGVHQVILTNASKVERNYFDTHWLSAEQYNALLLEGLAQQAHDTWLPRVSVHRAFRPLVEDQLDALSPRVSTRLVAHPQAQASILDVGLSARALLAVGPEGGWNDFELGLLAHHGFTPVSLGPRVLKTDVAVVSLLGVLQERLRQQPR